MGLPALTGKMRLETGFFEKKLALRVKDGYYPQFNI